MSSDKLPQVTSLAHRIRIAREAAGLKKIDLARATGLSLSYIGRIENGKSRPSRLALHALGTALGVEPDWLAQGKGERTTNRNQIPKGSTSAKVFTTQELDIERYLLGTPLASTFSRVPRSIRKQWIVSWQAFPDREKAEVRRIVGAFANAVLVVNQLPEELAKPLHREFEKQLRTYAASVFGRPAEGGEIS